MARPTISDIWASTGSAIDPGTSKVNTGWAAEIPPFETQNFWQNRADLLLQDLEVNGVMTWDALTVYKVGSWAMGSDRELYKSLTASNVGNDPISSSLNWKSFSSLISSTDATETVKGIAELATLAETQAGTDDTRIVTPKKLKDAIQQVVPDASTSTKGKVELATNAEAQTGTSTTLGITPAALSSVTATETRAGLVERATDAEVTAGTDISRYASVKQLTDKINTLVPSSSESIKGKIEIATQSETNTGLDDTRAITPKKLLGGFSVSLGKNGYIKFPSWLSGLTVQWFEATESTSSSNFRSFPTPFTTEVYSITATPNDNRQVEHGGGCTITSYDLNGVVFVNGGQYNTSPTQTAFLLAIGK